MIIKVAGEPPGVPKKPPRAPKESPRRPQKTEQLCQESPKTLSRPSSDRKLRIFKNRRISKLESMFLKVGRPAWELKIETERLKDEINNDSDKVRATRSKKKR